MLGFHVKGESTKLTVTQIIIYEANISKITLCIGMQKNQNQRNAHWQPDLQEIAVLNDTGALLSSAVWAEVQARLLRVRRECSPVTFAAHFPSLCCRNNFCFLLGRLVIHSSDFRSMLISENFVCMWLTKT